MICLSKHVYENQELIFWIGFAVLLVASFLSAIWMVYRAMKEYQELKATRWGLSRRDVVIYQGQEWEVWTNHHNGYITIRAFPERLCYQKVRLVDVYPIPEKPEIEIVNES